MLVGNNKVYIQLTGDRRNEDFARLLSGIAKKRGTHKTKQVYVRTLADAWHVNVESNHILMLQISELSGGIKLLSKILKLMMIFTKG